MKKKRRKAERCKKGERRKEADCYKVKIYLQIEMKTF